MDKETYRFMYPAGIASLSSVFSQKALQWLCGTTTDDNGRDTGNFMLFGEPVGENGIYSRRGQGIQKTAHAFRRSGAVTPKNRFPLNGTWAGSAYATCWSALTDMGLSDTCRSRVAAVMTFPCVRGWTTTDGNHTDNTFFHEQREE